MEDFVFYSIQQFANIYSEKMGVDAELLLKSLWGDFYFNVKAKKIVEGAQVNQHTHTQTAPINISLSIINNF